LWNGHLPSLLDEDGRVGRATPAEAAAAVEVVVAEGPSAAPDPARLLRPDELETLDRIRAAADAAGLPFGCLAVDGAHLYEPSVEARGLNRLRALRWCAIAARLGAQQIRIDTGGPADMPVDVFALIVAAYGDLIPRAAQLGLEVVMENHWGASRVAENVVQILQAVPDLGLLFDTGNWAPGTHAASWAMCARYATATHIKTWAFDEHGNETTMDIPQAVAHLLEAGYTGCWGIESVPREGDEYEAARQSLAFVRRLVGAPNAAEAA
jgi:sugar phosphate isomerase/epimerase